MASKLALEKRRLKELERQNDALVQIAEELRLTRKAIYTLINHIFETYDIEEELEDELEEGPEDE
jgi:hypothetical protein